MAAIAVMRLVAGGPSLCQHSPTFCNGTYPGDKLLLQGVGVTGFLPTELGLLTQVTGIDFSDTHLSGTLPSELALLTKLQSLQLNRIGSAARCGVVVCVRSSSSRWRAAAFRARCRPSGRSSAY